MAKNKGSHKTKNVFKVAGTRSLKLKTKAQKVSTDLKKLDIKTSKKSGKGQVAHIDQQLVALQKEVLQAKPQKNSTVSNKNQRVQQKGKMTLRTTTQVQTEAAANMIQGMQI